MIMSFKRLRFAVLQPKANCPLSGGGRLREAPNCHGLTMSAQALAYRAMHQAVWRIVSSRRDARGPLSEELENRAALMALYGVRVTVSHGRGIADHVWSVKEILELSRSCLLSVGLFSRVSPFTVKTRSPLSGQVLGHGSTSS
jgi:hypothetical protein